LGRAIFPSRENLEDLYLSALPLELSSLRKEPESSR
jgi:hypothetical protein